jgi:DNA-binding transcriptional ArsR family regulator
MTYEVTKRLRVFGEAGLVTVKQRDLSNVFYMLAEATRIAILEHIDHYGSATMGELMEALSCEEERMADHLKLLRLGMFVDARSEFGNMIYTINHEKMKQFKSMSADFFNSLDKISSPNGED